MYRVTWTIDIMADSPKEAAEMAHEIMLDPDSTATFFRVTKVGIGHSDTYEIDLLEGTE